MSESPGVPDRSEYEWAFGDYLVRGGFPEALAQEDPAVRIGLLQSYLDAVVLRDVLERYSLSNARGVRELSLTLVANNGNLVSMKRLADQLAARNIPMGRETVGQICGHLEDAFLVFFVRLYSYGLQKTRVNPLKVYASDPGLAFALSVAPSLNLAQRFEQAVYLELRVDGGQLLPCTKGKRLEPPRGLLRRFPPGSGFWTEGPDEGKPGRPWTVRRTAC